MMIMVSDCDVMKNIKYKRTKGRFSATHLDPQWKKRGTWGIT
jgi:hypothetical protein